MKTRYILTFFLFLLIIIGLIVPIIPTIAIEYENSGRLLAFEPIKENQRFNILYIHSVHRTPVKEFYYFNKNHDIIQYELQYESFAIGMPSNAHGNEKFVQENGKYYIKNMHRVFDDIDLSVGQVVANHKLNIKGQTVPFKEFVEPGTWVRIKYRKISFLEYLKGDEVIG